MRHAVFGQKLSRDINSRKALLNNLASSLLENGEITTTLAKAKFARGYVEKLITKAKKNKLNANRLLSSSLSKKAFSSLIVDIAPGFSQRSGGYTRIIKQARRNGDSAPMSKLALTKYEKVSLKSKPNKTKKPAKMAAPKKTNTKTKQNKKINEKRKA